MKVINLSEYNPTLGILIDVQHPLDYKNNPTLGSINIYADKLIMNHNKYLSKDKTYYIVCNKGILSRRVVHNLEYLGYKVIRVIK